MGAQGERWYVREEGGDVSARRAVLCAKRVMVDV